MKLDRMSQLIQPLLLHCAERFHQHLASGEKWASFLGGREMDRDRQVGVHPLPSFKAALKSIPEISADLLVRVLISSQISGLQAAVPGCREE